MASFKEKVLRTVKKIPQGKTLSYKQVAEKAGNPGAWRAVGCILSRNYNPDVPCHRVICSDGSVGGYNRGGPTQKKKLLKKEGCLLS